MRKLVHTRRDDMNILFSEPRQTHLIPYLSLNDLGDIPCFITSKLKTFYIFKYHGDIKNLPEYVRENKKYFRALDNHDFIIIDLTHHTINQ
jgi:hypothetical protein